MKKIILPLMLFCSAFLFLASCKHVPMDAIPAPAGGGSIGTSTVCFESDILPIFQTNCAKSGCHNSITAEKGYVFDSYPNIIRKGIIPNNATNSKVFNVLFETGNDKMPPAPNPDLSIAQKALIGRWINEGATNSSNCGSTCDSTQFKYGANVSVIISNYCLGCHAGSAPSANINLSNYAGVAAMASSGRLYGAVTHSAGFAPMPQNASKLNDCQISQIRKWTLTGAPNN
jgi:mono/diheme cytochrome c family protein